MREEALLFGPRRSLVGVITWPDESVRRTSRPAVLLLNSGILHRVGPNRTYVCIARRLAALGFVVLRFDFSGIGDSLPREDNLRFEQAAVEETQQAMAVLQARAGSTQFVLMGLCSGAALSFRVALHDSRVVGAVLINAGGHLHDERDEDLTLSLRNRSLRQHFRRIALHSSFRGKNWRKLLTGELNLPLLKQAILGFRLSNPLRRQAEEVTPRAYALARLQALSARRVRLLHIYSEGDEGLDYFYLVLGPAAAIQPMTLIRGANHTFTPLWSQERLVETICDWAQGFG